MQALEARQGFRFEHVYSAALRGFSARLTARQIADLEDDPTVAYIEPDGEMHAIAQTLPWGINQIDADLSSTLAGNGSGAINNVNVYIIDTGIGTHGDLNKVAHVNFANGKTTTAMAMARTWPARPPRATTPVMSSARLRARS